MIGQMTVDREHFSAWLSGTLIDMRSGVGLVVNEAECISANEALQRGETVLFRRGCELTGTSVRLIDGVYKEVKA